MQYFLVTTVLEFNLDWPTEMNVLDMRTTNNFTIPYLRSIADPHLLNNMDIKRVKLCPCNYGPLPIQ